jgi:hypothetical protein
MHVAIFYLSLLTTRAQVKPSVWNGMMHTVHFFETLTFASDTGKVNSPPSILYLIPPTLYPPPSSLYPLPSTLEPHHSFSPLNLSSQIPLESTCSPHLPPATNRKQVSSIARVSSAKESFLALGAQMMAVQVEIASKIYKLHADTFHSPE